MRRPFAWLAARCGGDRGVTTVEWLGRGGPPRPAPPQRRRSAPEPGGQPATGPTPASNRRASPPTWLPPSPGHATFRWRSDWKGRRHWPPPASDGCPPARAGFLLSLLSWSPFPEWFRL